MPRGTSFSGGLLLAGTDGPLYGSDLRDELGYLVSAGIQIIKNQVIIIEDNRIADIIPVTSKPKLVLVCLTSKVKLGHCRQQGGTTLDFFYMFY